MAVEEGAALGILVGSLSQSRLEDRKAHVPETLQLYEAMRKRRTTTNVPRRYRKQTSVPDG